MSHFEGPHSLDKIVSLIIPTYNRKHTLMKVIDSYLCQRNLKEIIFVVGGSTDGTFEYLKSLEVKIKPYPILKIERQHHRNFGLPNARNIGIKVATGEYIMMGEDDVILKENYVSTLLNCLQETGADIIAGRILYSKNGETLDETIERCNKYKSKIINYWAMSIMHSVPFSEHVELPFFHSIGLGKAEIYKKVLYNPDFVAREETDFYIRAGKTGAKLILCPHTMCFHLPQDKGKGGVWRVGIFRYQRIAIKNNNMLIDRHYEFMKEWGMKGNKFTFKFIHFLNRLRILYKYYRYSAKHSIGK